MINERRRNLKILNKQLLVGGLLSAVGLSTVVGVGMASAQSGTANTTDPMSSLVQKIASKFNLNKDEVQQVFDEEREAREAEREKRQSERLQKLVDEGTITSAQKTAIDAKIKELKTEREASKDSMKDLSDAERKAAMESKRTELETWTKSQGLDLSKLRGIFMGPHGHHKSPDSRN